VTIGLEGWPPADLVTALQERFNIVGRVVRDPAGVRFSTHFFNTEHEVGLVADALVRLVDEGYSPE
jgi:selenocysteine lyase/cysteine desulfurase